MQMEFSLLGRDTRSCDAEYSKCQPATVTYEGLLVIQTKTTGTFPSI